MSAARNQTRFLAMLLNADVETFNVESILQFFYNGNKKTTVIESQTTFLFNLSERCFDKRNISYHFPIITFQTILSAI